jgi:hypothetical protein
MTIDDRLDRLTGIVETLAGSVVAMDNQIEAHDRQIEALIALGGKTRPGLEGDESAMASLDQHFAPPVRAVVKRKSLFKAF